MTVDLFAIAVFCITATVLALVLRQYRPEFAIFVSLACSVVVVLYVAQSIGQVMEELNGLFTNTLLSEELIQVVLKCLGVCILTELAGQTCRDAGENAIGAKIELAGKVTLVVVSIPLFQQLLNVAGTLLNLS
jgi:stage III sporulation protein AD